MSQKLWMFLRNYSILSKKGLPQAVKRSRRMERYIYVITYFDNTIMHFNFTSKSRREFALSAFEHSKNSPSVNAIIVLRVSDDDDVEEIAKFERERDER